MHAIKSILKNGQPLYDCKHNDKTYTINDKTHSLNRIETTSKVWKADL